MNCPLVIFLKALPVQSKRKLCHFKLIPCYFKKKRSRKEAQKNQSIACMADAVHVPQSMSNGFC